MSGIVPKVMMLSHLADQTFLSGEPAIFVY